MAPLEDISNELFEMVVRLVDIKTMCSLRLVSRAISNMTDQATFQSYFRNIRVTLTLEGLKDFEKATAGLLGHRIEKVTLVGIHYDPHDLDALERYVEWTNGEIPDPIFETKPMPELAEKLARAKEDVAQLQKQRMEWISSQTNGVAVDLLSQAFDHISDKSAHRSLEILSFDVCVMRKPGEILPLFNSARLDRTEALSTAGTTFSLALSSLQKSRLERVNALDIYSSTDGYTRCALSFDGLSDALIRTGRAHGALLSNVRSLSINFANSLTTEHEYDWRSIRPELEQGNSDTSLAALLLTCSNVEDLHIAHCGVLRNFRRMDTNFIRRHTVVDRQIRHVIDLVTLPQLRKLQIGAVTLKAEGLAKLLLRFARSLESIRIISVRVEGRLSTALAPVTDGTCKDVDTLVVEDVYENGRHLLATLEQDHTRSSSSGGRYARRDVILRVGADVRRPFVYRTQSPERRYPSRDGCTVEDPWVSWMRL